MQQKGSPSTNNEPGKHIIGNPSTHIKPRQPIIDNDYNLKQIDTDDVIFLVSSYDHATVVHIDGHVLTAEQLCQNVIGGFIVDEVTSFQIHVVSTNMHTPTMY